MKGERKRESGREQVCNIKLTHDEGQRTVRSKVPDSDSQACTASTFTY